MFLFERIVGFGIYLLVLLLMCLLLTKTNAPAKPILKVYVLLLCVMAFFYKPYVTGDLYRIYDQMSFFSKMDFFSFWENYVIVSSTPMARVLYWFISKTGVFQLLPAVSAFICYSAFFYIIVRTQEKFSISKGNLAYTLFFIMTTSIYISVVGGIRMMLALSLLCFSFFRFTVLKRINVLDILFCIIALFMHSMGLLAVTVFIAVTIFKVGRTTLEKGLFALAVCVVSVLFVFNFRGVIDGILEKAIEYVFEERHSDLWEYIMGALIMLLLALLIIEFWQFRKDEDCLCLKAYNSAVVLCMLIAAVFCFEFSIFYRFGGQFAVILATPMLLVTLERADGTPSRSIRGVDFKSVLLVLSVFIAIISCTRGSLSSLKFFEL